MVLRNAFEGLATDAKLELLLNAFLDRYAPVDSVSQTRAAPGTADLVSAGPTESLEVNWLYAQAAASVGEDSVVVTFSLGTRTISVELTGSQPFAHGVVWKGSPGEDLTVTCSNASIVYLNADYRRA